jgi:hypothetical protein
MNATHILTVAGILIAGWFLYRHDWNKKPLMIALLSTYSPGSSQTVSRHEAVLPVRVSHDVIEQSRINRVKGSKWN